MHSSQRLKFACFLVLLELCRSRMLLIDPGLDAGQAAALAKDHHSCNSCKAAVACFWQRTWTASTMAADKPDLHRPATACNTVINVLLFFAWQKSLQCTEQYKKVSASS